MKRSMIIVTGLVLLSVMIEIAVLWPLYHWLITFHLFFVVVAAIAFVGDWRQTIWYALVHGALLDFYSPQVFGVYLCSGVLLTVVIATLQATWLKQRSLLSVATIGAMSLLVAQVVVLLWQWGSEALNITAWHLLVGLIPWSVGLNWLAMVLATTTLVRILSLRYEKLL